MRRDWRAWHEKLGAQTQTVTVSDGQPAPVIFTFAAPKAGTS